jgi:hypothetical protein
MKRSTPIAAELTKLPYSKHRDASHCRGLKHRIVAI